MSIFTSLHAAQDWGFLILRFILAATFVAHGTRKFAMWKMKPSEQMGAGILTILKVLSICEPLGAFALIAGFLTQLAALGLTIIMLGAIDLKARKMKAPFEVTQTAMGWEFELIIGGAAFLLFFTGGGAFSLDRLLFNL
jgi:putative oxidoreductase